MISIEKKKDHICVGKKLCLGWTKEKDMIGLSLTKWEIMKYGEEAGNIDFPWEYDVQGVSIKCIDAWGLLHYVVHLEDEWIAILQSSAALEKENIEGIDYWIVADEKTKSEIENLEMEGEIEILES